MPYYTPDADDWVVQANSKLCAPPPKGATDPLLRYMSRQHRLTHFIGNVLDIAKRLDERTDLLAEVNEVIGGTAIDRENLFRYESVVQQDADVMGELLATRAIDDMLTYIAQLLGLLFSTRPETLAQSNAEFKLRDVLKYGDMREFLEYAIETEVRRLSYQGMRDLYRDIKSKLGFRLFEDDIDLNLAVKAVAIRNLHTHNNGVIDARFAFELPEYKGREGQKVDGYNPIFIHSFATMAAVGIDERAREKWQLPAGTTEVPHHCHRFPRRAVASRSAEGETHVFKIDDDVAAEMVRRIQAQNVLVNDPVDE